MKILSFALLLFGILSSSGCDTLPIDPYITFNIERSASFQVPTTSAGVDTSVSTIVPIDTNKDYTKANRSAAGLLRTSEVTRVVLHSTDPNFTLDRLVYARLMIGTDTVAFDSIPTGTGTDFALPTRKVDVTAFMKDTSFVSTLGYRFLQPSTAPVTITASMTIVHTATQQ